MKKHIYILFAVLAYLMSACTSVGEEGEGPDNAVYMGTLNSSGVISMIVDNEEGGSTFVTPRLANIADEPVTITVGVDANILNEYNEKYSLELEPIAATDFVFVTKDGKESTGEAVVTIPQGDFQASVEVKMKSVDEQKYPFSKRFAIPVSIKEASKYKVLSSPTWTLIRLNRRLKTSVAVMSGGGFSIRPKTPFTEPMKEWTMQMSAIYTTLTRGNLTTAYMNAAGGGGELYTRISGTAGIQIKNVRDGDDTWTQQPLEAGKWLHISFVYKNSTVSVYVNGVLQKTFNTTPIYLSDKSDSGWTIGNEGYRNDHLREIRFWDRALTEGEIIDKLYFPQDPQTPGLLMYMPLTKESELNELTGNWNVTKHDGTSISFVDNVVFPADELVIEEPAEETGN